MAWGETNTVEKPLPRQSEDEVDFIKVVKKRFKECEDWEAQARINFEYDYKFANGDTHNKYQWDNDLVLSRELEEKPCLTINKTKIHNLMVINDAKQNKPGVRIRPVGDEATYEGGQIYQELVYHIEYISNAENVYDSATTWQVEAGIGYWRIVTDYISENTFDQEIYIRRIKDPRSVYLDPNINELDGSDARYGFIFEDIPRDLFEAQYPEWAALASEGALNQTTDMWIAQNYVRIAEYFCKEEKKDKLVTWVWQGGEVEKKYSELEENEKIFYKELKANRPLWQQYQFQERKIITSNITWYKIAGNRTISEQKWLGKYIPIVRLVGTETVIDGRLDRKGHTRGLINPQQMYNYNSSALIEFGALQTKSPYVAASAAIEGFEEYYKTGNRVNHSYMPYNAFDDEGNELPPPKRAEAPQASPAYISGLQIAQNEMMMATGQYQSQIGENENAKSGVAINARQRQGDRATYHFIDNQAIAIRFTGKIIIDLIPKIYDTPRIKKILAQDGNRINVKIDVNAKQGLQDVTPNPPNMDNGQKIKEVIFNPDFGMYDIQADTGPSFATKRMETAQNMMELIKADPEKMLGLGGDILFKNMDFAGADILALRFNNMLPPQVKGEGLPPEVEQVMHQASDHIQQLTAQVQDLEKQLKDKTTELTQKGQRLDLDFKDKASSHAREDYKAETERLTSMFNTGADGSGIDPQLKKVFQQLLQGMINNGELEFKDNEDKEPEGLPEGAKRAADGNYYLQNEQGWNRVDMTQ